jgi:DNA-binding winged helix-turn-helix (wHTH) protein/TolB-like protein
MGFTFEQLQPGFRIGEYLIEPRSNRIVRGESEVRLEPKVMDVLVCLAAHAGEVVSRETLNAQVWRDVVVTDQAVTNCISGLRQHLGDDRGANRVIETIPKRGYRLVAPVQLAAAAPASQSRPASDLPAGSPAAPGASPATTPRRFLALAAMLAAAALVTGWWYWTRTTNPPLTSIAVARFENAAKDESLSYLGLALPDEIATLLTKSRGLAVRPGAQVDSADPLDAARSRGVDHIVTGRYYLENKDQISLVIEAQHVGQERVIWRTRITAPAGDLLALRARIADGVQQGLLPALGAHAVTPGPTPVDAEAYRLYLRSLELPQQPKATDRAIEMLERAVTLEPQFAPAWHALGLRYYAYGTWHEGGRAARDKSVAAHRRALELDPDLISAARSIVTSRTETGDLGDAYQEGRKLLDHFGPGADTYFTLSYIHRYGGLLDSAQRYCELALSRDPQDPGLRSCAYAYLYAGKLNRVVDFLKLGEGSYFVHWGMVLYYLRMDDRAAALRATRQAEAEPTRGLMEPCLAGASGAALDVPVAEFVTHWWKSEDPETPYAVAPMLMYCGRGAEALRFLDRAVDLGFCAFPAMDQDPIWATLRADPEFLRIRAKAQACHERFRRSVEAQDSASRK